jgi:hypothetical protein
MKREYYCENLNGSVTGVGTATERPDGRWDVRASFGSPWAGNITDDGPVYEGVTSDPDRWMASYRLQPS